MSLSAEMEGLPLILKPQFFLKQTGQATGILTVIYHAHIPGHITGIKCSNPLSAINCTLACFCSRCQSLPTGRESFFKENGHGGSIYLETMVCDHMSVTTSGLLHPSDFYPSALFTEAHDVS